MLLATIYALYKTDCSLFLISSKNAAVAQLVERVLGKDEVMGSTPISSSGRQSWDFRAGIVKKNVAKIPAFL